MRVYHTATLLRNGRTRRSLSRTIVTLLASSSVPILCAMVSCTTEQLPVNIITQTLNPEMLDASEMAKRDPTDVGAILAYAREVIREGDIPRARARLDNALELQSDPRLLSLRAELEENPELLEALAREILAEDPSHPMAYFHLGKALRHQGRHDEAYEALVTQVNTNGIWTGGWSELAIAAAMRGERTEALVYIVRAINIIEGADSHAPPWMYYFMADLYEGSNWPDDAERIRQRVVTDVGPNPTASYPKLPPDRSSYPLPRLYGKLLIGITLEDTVDSSGELPTRIVRVASIGSAASADLRAGDTLLAVGENKINSSADLIGIEYEETPSFLIERDGAQLSRSGIGVSVEEFDGLARSLFRSASADFEAKQYADAHKKYTDLSEMLGIYNEEVVTLTILCEILGGDPRRAIRTADRWISASPRDSTLLWLCAHARISAAQAYSNHQAAGRWVLEAGSLLEQARYSEPDSGFLVAYEALYYGSLNIDRGKAYARAVGLGGAGWVGRRLGEIVQLQRDRRDRRLAAERKRRNDEMFAFAASSIVAAIRGALSPSTQGSTTATDPWGTSYGGVQPLAASSQNTMARMQWN